MAKTKTEIEKNDAGVVIYRWTNTVKVTSDNILETPHVLQIECVDNLTDEQKTHFIYATLKRQVQQFLRLELKASEKPEYLHSVYPESEVYHCNASSFAFTGKRDADPRTAIRKGAKSLKKTGMSKAEILAMLAAELEDDEDESLLEDLS